MGTKVREANIKDIGNLFRMAKKLATSFDVKGKDFSKSFEEVLRAKNAYCMIAVQEDGYSVGYLLGFDHPSFYANGCVSWVEEIYVKPRYRQEGVGSLLMHTFEEDAQKRGSKLIALATRRAETFYQSIGYEESATYFKKHL